MNSSIVTRGAAVLAFLGAAVCAPAFAAAANDHPAVKRAFSLPPSADISFGVQARQRGLALKGESLTSWRRDGDQYAIVSDTRVPLFGKIIEHRSEGAVDAYGLAPASFYEKRLRKDATTTTFDRDSKSIVFSASGESYRLKGGEQDRVSAVWQLLAIARANPGKFKPGSEWTLFVAGPRDAEPWSFKVINTENVATGQGEVNAVHLVKAPPPDAQGQQVDLWLAPTLNWYPVRVRFADNDGDFVEQTLEKISHK
jgi:hypothetical protein